MKVEKRIKAFSKLGEFLRLYSSGKNTELDYVPDGFIARFNNTIKEHHVYNPWFIERFVKSSLDYWGKILTATNLEKWLKKYNIPDNMPGKKVGIVMAGNIPLVGFHDLLCVLFSGNRAYCKLSSKDDHLLPLLMELLTNIEPGYKDYIRIEKDHLKYLDAVIATGSTNTSRYFEYYFKKYPSIIRKNRNSMAVLWGDENDEQLHLLSDDIFMYFGLGCRSVSKLFIPEGYKFNRFFDALEKYAFLANHNKYANNYEYNRSIYLVNKVEHLDNGFVILKPDNSLYSPLAVLFYQTYKSTPDIDDYIHSHQDQLQCVISSKKINADTVEHGKSQYPELSDYADNIDTIKFLLTLK